MDAAISDSGGSSPYDVTLDAPRDSDSTGATSPGMARVALVEGSGPCLVSETGLLLRSRLRAAALVLFTGSGAFLAFSLYSPQPYQQASLFVPLFHALLVIVLGLTALVLCARCPGSLARLRLAELVVFGLTAVFFAVLEYKSFAYYAQQNDVATLSTVHRAAVIYWIMLIFTYCIFIPNSLGRVATIVGLMAMAPLAIAIYARWRFPAAHQVIDGQHLVWMALVMGMVYLTGIYGTYNLGALRQAAFEARQLGQYRLRERIGAGGMGEVYLAEHQLLKRPCAIKLIRPQQAGDPKALARFEREVRTTAQLSHWNSVEIFDYGHAADGTFFYVMEYLPGMSLNHLVRQHGPQPAERVIHFLSQTCDALTEAHGLGLVHRDIKPGNIFAAHRGGRYDVTKLLDFGLVKPLMESTDQALTQDGSITGSPLYMPPEQALDQTPDARSDIYALGAVGYFLLAGRPPFEADSALKLLFAHAHDPVVPPSQHNADTPDDLEQVILRCLAKKPADRYATAQELRQALDDCAASGNWTEERARAWWQRQPAEQGAAVLA